MAPAPPSEAAAELPVATDDDEAVPAAPVELKPVDPQLIEQAERAKDAANKAFKGERAQGSHAGWAQQ